jgi:flagellar hook protein FlgE
MVTQRAADRSLAIGWLPNVLELVSEDQPSIDLAEWEETMGSFSIALSGLEADSTALNTIGNNLANINTTAYKGQTTSFEDLFYQQIGRSGSGDAIQVGAGTKVSGTVTDFSQGTILPDPDYNSTDMALDGNGFFMVEQNGQLSLTRAGNFQVASNGNLITADGQQVLGYPVVNQAAKATQNFSVTANLDSTVPTGTFSSQVQIFDSLGNSHLATVTYARTTNIPINAWDYSVTLPAGDATGVPTTNTGTLFFDSSGNVEGPVVSMTFPGLVDGANPLVLTFDRSGITGLPTASVNISSTQDGSPEVSGIVTTNPQPITLPVGSTELAQATQNISATVNLNEGALVGTKFATPITVFDSLGQSHLATIAYKKTNTNRWTYAVTLPPGDASGTPINNTGTLTFDSSGNLTSPMGNVAGISFPGMANGASDLTFNWNLSGSDSTPTITQLASVSSNGIESQDGFASGIYAGITVDPSGMITVHFSNGQERTVGQIAVATVASEQGLVARGANDFQTTAASGPAVAGVAGTGGRGTVDDAALEQSNINIATEFSNLIVVQRAFEANAKTITTFDTLSQDVIAMIR